ncbi:hypothetical protein HK101_005985, partial [Irineochytrium annulatum]
MKEIEAVMSLGVMGPTTSAPRKTTMKSGATKPAGYGSNGGPPGRRKSSSSQGSSGSGGLYHVEGSVRSGGAGSANDLLMGGGVGGGVFNGSSRGSNAGSNGGVGMGSRSNTQDWRKTGSSGAMSLANSDPYQTMRTSRSDELGSPQSAQFPTYGSGNGMVSPPPQWGGFNPQMASQQGGAPLNPYGSGSGSSPVMRSAGYQMPPSPLSSSPQMAYPSPVPAANGGPAQGSYAYTQPPPQPPSLGGATGLGRSLSQPASAQKGPPVGPLPPPPAVPLPTPPQTPSSVTGAATGASTGNIPVSANGTHVFRVMFAFAPTLEDEIALEGGDLVEVLEVFDDGWARGRSLRHEKTGYFPVRCLKLAEGASMTMPGSSAPSSATNTPPASASVTSLPDTGSSSQAGSTNGDGGVAEGKSEKSGFDAKDDKDEEGLP